MTETIRQTTEQQAAWGNQTSRGGQLGDTSPAGWGAV